MVINPFLFHLRLLVKQSKYIIPVLSIFSVVRQVFFYSFFQIQIGYYISITEILSMFLNDAVLYCVFYLILLITTAFIPTSFLEYNNEQVFAKAGRSIFRRFFFHPMVFPMLLLPLLLGLYLLIAGKPWEYVFSAFLALQYYS